MGNRAVVLRRGERLQILHPSPYPLPQGAREYDEKFATARMCALKGLEQSEGLQVKSVFFFFGSLFLFASQQKEKVNKRHTHSGFYL